MCFPYLLVEWLSEYCCSSQPIKNTIRKHFFFFSGSLSVQWRYNTVVFHSFSLEWQKTTYFVHSLSLEWLCCFSQPINGIKSLHSLTGAPNILLTEVKVSSVLGSAMATSICSAWGLKPCHQKFWACMFLFYGVCSFCLQWMLFCVFEQHFALFRLYFVFCFLEDHFQRLVSDAYYEHQFHGYVNALMQKKDHPVEENLICCIKELTAHRLT